MSGPSGHPATYSKVGGITKASYLCACHGRPFDTRGQMQMHIKQYHKRVRSDFEALIREGGLGQQAWDRLPGETALQYARFKAYLTTTDRVSHKRSVERTAAILGDSNVLRFRRASAQFHWQIRSSLLDQHIEREELGEFIRQKAKSARSQARLGQKLQALSLAGASAMLSDADRVNEMTGHEISKLADVGVKIERLANSDPTAITEDRSVRIVWEGPRPDWAPRDDQDALPARTVTTIEGE